MAIQALENEVEMVVTWLCNWKCDYCSVDTHNRPKLTMEEVEKKLNEVPFKSIVTLSGGEVGMMKRNEIEFIISKLKSKDCKIHLNTNGLFIKRYKDLLKNFDYILYHCSENLDLDEEIIIDDDLKLEYMLIVTDNNYHKLENFLRKYPNIKFHIVSSTMPKGINNVTLNKKIKNSLIKKYHHRMTIESKKRIFTEKNFDAIKYL